MKLFGFKKNEKDEERNRLERLRVKYCESLRYYRMKLVQLDELLSILSRDSMLQSKYSEGSVRTAMVDVGGKVYELPLNNEALSDAVKLSQKVCGDQVESLRAILGVDLITDFGKEHEVGKECDSINKVRQDMGLPVATYGQAVDDMCEAVYEALNDGRLSTGNISGLASYLCENAKRRLVSRTMATAANDEDK